jgi:hypothetical protein
MAFLLTCMLSLQIAILATAWTPAQTQQDLAAQLPEADSVWLSESRWLKFSHMTILVLS